MTVGDPVLRTGKPLSVELGPGLMTNIYESVSSLQSATLQLADNHTAVSRDLSRLFRRNLKVSISLVSLTIQWSEPRTDI